MTYTDYIITPIGVIEIQASLHGITHVTFPTPASNRVNPSELTQRCQQQLNEYFAGQRRVFDLPLEPQGTPFQRSIWVCLLRIPFGQTASYRAIAEMANNRQAVRAVGAANGKNPIGIIVPCHRVIGSDGTLTGYAGGLERKAWLLEHEGVSVEK